MLVTILNAALKNCPDKLAVSDQLKQMTYAQLDCLSAQLALGLKQKGCGRVAVSMARSCDWIVTFIGILRAGLTYIPIAPNNEQEFIKQRLEEAKADILIQDTSCLQEAPCPVVSYSTLTEPPMGKLDFRPESTTPGFAYCIFTSGSTGKPKAVEVSYANLWAHHVNLKSVLPINATDKVLQFCAISFDVSIEEVLSSILAQASLLVFAQSHNAPVGDFHDVLHSQQVNLVNIPTAYFNLWVEYCKEQRCPFPESLQTVVIGSEACKPQTIKTWLTSFSPRPRLLNAYGLTETTITNAVWQCPDSMPENMESVPIGKAIGDNQLVILDEKDAVVKSQEKGALAIIGEQLCDYTHPANYVSAARVVRIKSANHTDTKAMLTGDVAFKDAQGDYHVIGRTDSQVKINGYRINLNTLANTFSNHDEVVHCVVKLVDVGQNRQLCLYLQLAEGYLGDKTGILPVASNEQIREIVAQSHGVLPGYAIPKFYCVVQSFDFTANGKIDTRTLPDTLAESEAFVHNSGLPTELEALLKNILGNMQLTEDVSFLGLGGDSISAQRFSSEARRLGYEVSVKSLLSDVSLVQLLSTHALVAAHTPKQDELISKFPQQTLPKSLLLSLFQQTELWQRIKYLRVATPTQSDMLTHSRLHGREGDLVEQVEGRLQIDDIHRFKQAWQRVISSHDGLTSVFVSHQDDWYFLCLKDLEPLWHEVSEPADGLPALLRQDRLQGFTQMEQALMRFTLVRYGVNDFHFIWTYHHALLDGWSDMSILDQVFALYYTNSELSDVHAPSIFSYLDYLDSADNEAQVKGYWRDYLKNTRPFYLSEHFYPQKSAPSGLHNSEREVTLHFPDTDIADIKGQLARENLTLSTLCHGAVFVACSSLSAIPELVIGSVQSARDCQLPRVNNMMGLMINHVPVVASCEPHKRFADLLKEIQQDIYRHMSFADHYSNNKNFLNDIGVDSESLYDTVVVVENLSFPEFIETEKLTSHAQSGLPLSIYFWPTNNGLDVQIKYWPEMLDESFIKNLQKNIKKVFVNFEMSCNLKGLV